MNNYLGTDDIGTSLMKIRNKRSYKDKALLKHCISMKRFQIGNVSFQNDLRHTIFMNG